MFDIRNHMPQINHYNSGKSHETCLDIIRMSMTMFEITSEHSSHSLLSYCTNLYSYMSITLIYIREELTLCLIIDMNI
jgi:hypothetical protein